MIVITVDLENIVQQLEQPVQAPVFHALLPVLIIQESIHVHHAQQGHILQHTEQYHFLFVFNVCQVNFHPGLGQITVKNVKVVHLGHIQALMHQRVYCVLQGHTPINLVLP